MSCIPYMVTSGYNFWRRRQISTTAKVASARIYIGCVIHGNWKVITESQSCGAGNDLLMSKLMLQKEYQKFVLRLCVRETVYYYLCDHYPITSSFWSQRDSISALAALYKKRLETLDYKLTYSSGSTHQARCAPQSLFANCPMVQIGLQVPMMSTMRQRV